VKPTNQKPIFLNDLCVGGPKAPRPKSKYKAEWCEVDGIKFQSKREARVYQNLKLMEKSGAIKAFRRQVPYRFAGNGERITYRADFVVTFADGHAEVWDAKGFKTSEYIIKKKLMKIFYNIDIVEV
jgi:hypothetical protein